MPDQKGSTASAPESGISLVFPASDFPPSLPYVICVQTCGKRWDLYIYINRYIHTCTCTYIVCTRTHIYIYIMGTSCVQLNGHVGDYFIFRHAGTKTIQNPFILHKIYTVYIRRKFRSQTSDNMDRWKAEQGRGRDKRQIRRKKSKKKEDADAWKGRKVAKHCVFQWFGAPEGRKVGSLKQRVRSQLARWEVVAWSTFPSQNVQNTPCSDHFWKLRCRKSARRCGAKHILKSKCTKHTMVRPLLEVEMSKKCTP